MEIWELRLEHERTVRDGFVACGNPKVSDQPDPPGGMIPVKSVHQFRGLIYWTLMEERGHDKGKFEECKCSYEARKTNPSLRVPL